MEKPRLTLQQRREVRRLRSKGLKLWEVAATIGCSRATVTRVLAGPGISSRGSSNGCPVPCACPSPSGRRSASV